MNSYDRIRFCTERDLIIRARSHLQAYLSYAYKGKSPAKIPYELEDCDEFLSNELYKIERELLGEESDSQV